MLKRTESLTQLNEIYNDQKQLSPTRDGLFKKNCSFHYDQDNSLDREKANRYEFQLEALKSLLSSTNGDRWRSTKNWDQLRFTSSKEKNSSLFDSFDQVDSSTLIDDFPSQTIRSQSENVPEEHVAQLSFPGSDFFLASSTEPDEDDESEGERGFGTVHDPIGSPFHSQIETGGFPPLDQSQLPRTPPFSLPQDPLRSPHSSPVPLGRIRSYWLGDEDAEMNIDAGEGERDGEGTGMGRSCLSISREKESVVIEGEGLTTCSDRDQFPPKPVYPPPNPHPLPPQSSKSHSSLAPTLPNTTLPFPSFTRPTSLTVSSTSTDDAHPPPLPPSGLLRPKSRSRPRPTPPSPFTSPTNTSLNSGEGRAVGRVNRVDVTSAVAFTRSASSFLSRNKPRDIERERERERGREGRSKFTFRKERNRDQGSEKGATPNHTLSSPSAPSRSPPLISPSISSPLPTLTFNPLPASSSRPSSPSLPSSSRHFTFKGWHGVEVDKQDNIVEIRLLMNDLRGPLPSSFCNLPFLVLLNLSNNHLSGPIPPAISKLRSLRLLKLNDNHLSGPLPESLGSLSQLTRLYLDSNALSGPIPPSLGSLTRLVKLNLSHNQLTGSIPSSFVRLSVLQDLRLSHNRLSGPLPPSLFSLGRRRNFTERLGRWLDRLRGEDEEEFEMLGEPGKEMESLGEETEGENPSTSMSRAASPISSPRASTPTPLPPSPSSMAVLWTWIVRLLSFLLSPISRLYFYVRGPIVERGMSELRLILLNDNEFSGPVPSTLGYLPHLQKIHLNNNRLSGHIPSSFAPRPLLHFISRILFVSSDMIKYLLPLLFQGTRASSSSSSTIPTNSRASRPASNFQLTPLFFEPWTWICPSQSELTLRVEGNALSGPSSLRELRSQALRRSLWNCFGLTLLLSIFSSLSLLPLSLYHNVLNSPLSPSFFQTCLYNHLYLPPNQSNSSMLLPPFLFSSPVSFCNRIILDYAWPFLPNPLLSSSPPPSALYKFFKLDPFLPSPLLSPFSPPSPSDPNQFLSLLQSLSHHYHHHHLQSRPRPPSPSPQDTLGPQPCLEDDLFSLSFINQPFQLTPILIYHLIHILISSSDTLPPSVPSSISLHLSWEEGLERWIEKFIREVIAYENNRRDDQGSGLDMNNNKDKPSKRDPIPIPRYSVRFPSFPTSSFASSNTNGIEICMSDVPPNKHEILAYIHSSSSPPFHPLSSSIPSPLDLLKLLLKSFHSLPLPSQLPRRPPSPSNIDPILKSHQLRSISTCNSPSLPNLHIALHHPTTQYSSLPTLFPLPIPLLRSLFLISAQSLRLASSLYSVFFTPSSSLFHRLLSLHHSVLFPYSRSRDELRREGRDTHQEQLSGHEDKALDSLLSSFSPPQLILPSLSKFQFESLSFDLFKNFSLSLLTHLSPFPTTTPSPLTSSDPSSSTSLSPQISTFMSFLSSKCQVKDPEMSLSIAKQWASLGAESLEDLWLINDQEIPLAGLDQELSTESPGLQTSLDLPLIVRKKLKSCVCSLPSPPSTSSSLFKPQWCFDL